MTAASIAPGRSALAALPGEDISSERLADALRWLAVYTDLLRFNTLLLERARAEVPRLLTQAQVAAQTDVEILRDQQRAYQDRADLWYRRVWELQGLSLDNRTRTIRHVGKERRLSTREYQLLRCLVDRPHRAFTTADILGRAWGDDAHFPQQARNYIRRLRKILVDLDCPCEIVSHRQRGYALIFSARTTST
ncbi:MAG: winged helix-turn-helix domain-containing protein [Candidatus Dormibacteria bacterium]